MKFVERAPLRINPGEKILVRAHHWIGDVILCTPALRALREAFPEAHISVTAKPWVIPVLSHNPHIDQIIYYNRTGLKRDALGVLRLVRVLRSSHFKAAVLLRRSFEGALSAFLARIPLRVGYNTDGRGVLLTHKAKVDCRETPVHRVEDDLRLLEGFGIRSSSKKLVLLIDPQKLDKAFECLRKQGFSPGERIFGISPGSKGTLAKRWYHDRFAEIVRRVSKHYGAKCIILGASFERELGDQIVDEAGVSGVVNFAGTVGLDEAFALISLCGLFLSNDSGLMHAAAALDVPLGAIFGQTDFRRTAPWSDKSKLIRLDLDCFSCQAHRCPYGHRCMNEIDVEWVFSELNSLIDQHGFDTLEERKGKTPLGKALVPVDYSWKESVDDMDFEYPAPQS